MLRRMSRRRLLDGPVPVLSLVLAAAVWASVRGGFQDLSVYRYAGEAVLHGLPLSSDPATGLPVTYPPFAAVAMTPLAVVPGWLAAGLWTGASVAALAAVVRLVRLELVQPAPGWLVAILAAAALALEPVWQTLTFGQLNLLLLLAVLVDLLRPERRWSGVLVGIAAGIKLTPLLLLVLLLVVGRRAAAGRATACFLATVAIGLVVRPGTSTAYWTERLVDASRVGPPELAHNQSVYGVLTRWLGHEPTTWVWLAAAVPLALAVLAVAAAWWRHGDRVLGSCLAGLATLLASPVSWSHHWVWAVPTTLALWARHRWLAAAWAAVFVARPILWPPHERGRELGWGVLDHVVGNAYVVAAVALTAWAGASLWHTTRVTTPRD
jgi:alpha-1,2-mannosyltransferase